jgi:lipid A oxidase
MEAPPYWGARVMWWRNSGLGFGIEVTHAKAYMSDVDRNALGFERMEFSDGHNLITANIGKRWDKKWVQFSPYWMAGLGVAIPHVDSDDGTNRTFGYQLSGPALRLTAGAKYDLNSKLAAFAEYQFTASENMVELDGGGELNSRLFTNAINIGLSMKF